MPKYLKCFIVITVMHLLYWQTSFSAQAVELTDRQIKVAYVHNFIKLIQWPNEQSLTDFTVAVYEDKSIYQIFLTVFSQRKIKNKNINIVFYESFEQGKQAQLVYYPVTNPDEFTELTNTLRGSHTLIVSDNSLDKHNVMINLSYSKEKNAMSFEVNKSNIIYEELLPSDELLLLGGTELDVATLYRQTQQAMQEIRDREVLLNKRLTLKEELLTTSEIKLVNSNTELNKSLAELTKQNLALENIRNEVGTQRNNLLVSEKKLIDLTTDFQKTRGNLAKEQNSLKEKEKENNQMAASISDSKNILQQLTHDISKQTKQLESKNIELSDRKEKIDTQQKTISVISILMIVAIISSLLIIILFVKNRKTTLKLSDALKNIEATKDQLVESEKLAALGGLVAGVAHEINTPIGICVTASSHLEEKLNGLEQDFLNGKISKSHFTNFIDESKDVSRLLQNNLSRAAELITSFKRVSVDQSIEVLHKINIRDSIQDIINSVKPKYKHSNINIELVCPEMIILNTYPGVLAQIITNFIINSSIHAFTTPIGNNHITIKIIKNENENEYTLRYEDNGQGIPSNELTKIFDPFYTTKKNQGGTGLGLNIVYNLINKTLKSRVEYGSIVNKGTWFEFKLNNLKDI